jgi:hypothetical protein
MVFNGRIPVPADVMVSIEGLAGRHVESYTGDHRQQPELIAQLFGCLAGNGDSSPSLRC